MSSLEPRCWSWRLHPGGGWSGVLGPRTDGPGRPRECAGAMGAGPSSQRSCSPRAYAIAWQQRPCVCSTCSQHEPTQASMYTDAQTGPATTDHEVLLCTEYGKGGKAIRCKQPITGPTVGHAACTVGHVCLCVLRRNDLAVTNAVEAVPTIRAVFSANVPPVLSQRGRRLPAAR